MYDIVEHCLREMAIYVITVLTEYLLSTAHQHEPQYVNGVTGMLRGLGTQG